VVRSEAAPSLPAAENENETDGPAHGPVPDDPAQMKLDL